MSMEKQQFHNALNRLESMAKGGATQLHHTSSDSNPQSWPGGAQSDQNEHVDGIDDNGTDYTGVKKSLGLKVEGCEALTHAEVAILKGMTEDAGGYIQHKINNQQHLTKAEHWFYHGGWQQVQKASTVPGKAGKSGEDDTATVVPPTNAGGDTNSEIEADANKSFAGNVAGNQTLQEGIELSPFLYEFTRAMAEGLEGVEARISKGMYDLVAPLYEHIEYLQGALTKSVGEQAEFNKGFATTIVGIGQHVAGGAEVQAQQQYMPQGPPKSQLRALPGGQGQQQQQFQGGGYTPGMSSHAYAAGQQQGGGAPQGVNVMEKSFTGPGGLDVSQHALNKSQISSAMVELVKAGRLNALEVSKFEMTDTMSPQVEQMVKSFAAAGGNPQ